MIMTVFIYKKKVKKLTRGSRFRPIKTNMTIHFGKPMLMLPIKPDMEA
jgi:hypothetical protein